MVRLYMRQVSLFQSFVEFIFLFSRLPPETSNNMYQRHLWSFICKESKWQETFWNVLTQTDMVRIGSWAAREYILQVSLTLLSISCVRAVPTLLKSVLNNFCVRLYCAVKWSWKVYQRTMISVEQTPAMLIGCKARVETSYQQWQCRVSLPAVSAAFLLYTSMHWLSNAL